MLKVYHAPGARSFRVLWLLEELGATYDVAAEKIGSFSDELKALNPLGTVPVVLDGERKLTESIVILDYIASLYGGERFTLDPQDPDYWDNRELMMFGEATLTAPINFIFATVFAGPADQQDNFTLKVVRDSIRRRLRVVQQRVAQQPFVMGERFTLADISIGYLVDLALKAAPMGLVEHVKPEVAAYHGRLAERPAFQRALAR